MINSLPDFYLYNFNFLLEAAEDMRLPEYKGSMFRGAFGWSFRNSVCMTKKPDCTGCILQQQCAYFKIFETEIPDNNIWFLKGVKKVPHPFIIHPPRETKNDYKKGELIKVGLTIFGNMINFFPFFIFNFIKMGELGIGVNRSKFSLISVMNLDQDGSEFVVYGTSGSLVKNEFCKISMDNSASGHQEAHAVELEFLTPARMQREGRVIADKRKVTFDLLVSLLERRLYALSHLFCDKDLYAYPRFITADKASITENNLYFYDWERYSSRQGRKVEMSGFKGKIKIEGELSEFMPLLKIGERINIGKNTLFGLGQYKMETV
jgi:hypothetical protein